MQEFIKDFTFWSEEYDEDFEFDYDIMENSKSMIFKTFI